MHLDKYGLPVQADGDANDQLQRVGMILTANALGEYLHTADGDPFDVNHECFTAIISWDSLQPSPGVYTRYVDGNPNNVSADQLLPVLASHVANRDTKSVWNMFKAMTKRLGFAQNTRDGLDQKKTKWKLPDFMALRALPLFARAHKVLYPVAFLADLSLVLLALFAVGPVQHDDKLIPTKRNPDDVDDNVIITTLITCRAIMPTPLSWLAAKLYAKLRPNNYGNIQHRTMPDGSTRSIKYNNVYGALRWYHRAEAGGNPEIAELYESLVRRYLS